MSHALALSAFRMPQGANARMMSDRPADGTSSHVGPGGLFAASSSFTHDPVMVEEILADLRLRPGSTVVDGTLGLGGHSERFLQEVSPGGTLVGLDWDETMLERARARLQPREAKVVLVHDDFRNLSSVLDRLQMRADGILLDLGLNSAQVDDPARGFSFQKEGPLDMRMDKSRGEPAAAILNRMSPLQIERMLKELGDEKWAKKIAQIIVDRRKAKPLQTTKDLVDCVLAAIPAKLREERIHPATRTFQAVRIYVNGELEGLDQALVDAAWSLAEEGTLAVLSYHSGEDRIVKNVFRDLSSDGFEDLHRKPLSASADEVRRNPRSRSAKLRSLRRKPLRPGR